VSLGRTAALSDTGRKRRHNEDSFVLQPPVFVVADGMGGANAGEVASGLAVEAVKEESRNGGSGEGAVASLVQEANRRVYKRATEDSSASGMGTTMTMALVEDDKVRFGHVGDSRAYLVRDGELIQLTDDHSLVGELVRSGKLAPEEAESHPQRSVITRALGTDPDVDVDTFTQETRSGDIFVLCSDGLYSMIGNAKILELVERNRADLNAVAKSLIAAANKAGGDDNITVVAFEIAAPGEETIRLPAAPEPQAAEEEAEPEDEDTLTEADEVPAVSTMVIRPEDVQQLVAQQQQQQSQRSEEEAPVAEPAPEPAVAPRAEPDEQKPRKGRRALVIGLLLLAIVAAVVIYLLSR
jgi:serine/threonine protein phosphatase PrpC